MVRDLETARLYARQAALWDAGMGDDVNSAAVIVHIVAERVLINGPATTVPRRKPYVLTAVLHALGWPAEVNLPHVIVWRRRRKAAVPVAAVSGRGSRSHRLR